MAEDPPPTIGVLGPHLPDARIDKEARQALQVWRGQSRLGKVKMLEYLDKYRGGSEGFASDLHRCTSSEDPRAATAALKLEAQLREWFTEEPAPAVTIDQRSQSVNVDARQVNIGMDAVTREWLSDPAKRAAAKLLSLDEMTREVEVDPDPPVGSNGKDSREE